MDVTYLYGLTIWLLSGSFPISCWGGKIQMFLGESWWHLKYLYTRYPFPLPLYPMFFTFLCVHCACFTFDFNISRFVCIFNYLFIPSLLDGNLGMHMWVCTEFVLLSLNFNLLRIFHICLQRWNFKKWKKKRRLIVNICVLLFSNILYKRCSIGIYTI